MSFIEFWTTLAAIANDAETVANFVLVFAFLRWLAGFRWITYTFVENVKATDSQPATVRVHVLRMRVRDVNASSLTNAVSSAFYGGGFLPSDVRQQVIEFTNPTYKVG